MSNKQQTAVEWLEQEFEKRLPLGVGDVLIDLIKQAKELEKKHIIDAHLTGLIHPLEMEATKQAEQYYNETFKSE